MKKRTVFLGAILSLMPMGQPLIMKIGVVFSTTSLMLTLPEKVNAESASFYFNSGNDKNDAGDYYGAISDFTKAIEIDPNYSNPYLNRGIAKENLGDMNGACDDWRKASSLGNESTAEWVRDQC